MELEYISICSYNEQLKNENDLLQRLLADCKYSYEKQYLSFSQYEQYLIDYERCIEQQQTLIRMLQQFIDRVGFTAERSNKREDDSLQSQHIYQKINDLSTNIETESM